MGYVDFKSMEAKLDSILENGDSNTSQITVSLLNAFPKCDLNSVANRLNIKIVTAKTEKSKTGSALGSGASPIEPFAEPELRMPSQWKSGSHHIGIRSGYWAPCGV